MPSADANLRNSIQVGNISATGPETLLILLNLYASNNTDYTNWVQTLESHGVTLRPFLAARPPNQLTHWQDAFSLDDLKRGALAIANQVNLAGISNPSEESQRRSQIGRSLANLIDPMLARQAELTCRLTGQSISIPDPAVTDALRYFDRALASLHGSPLLTRLAAVAFHCSSHEEVDVGECASLLSLSVEQISSVCSDVRFSDATDLTTDDSAPFRQALDIANLVESSLALARQTSRDTAIQTLAAGLFGSRAVTTFTENSSGWFNESHKLDSPHSMIHQAATTSKPVSTHNQVATVEDEKVLGSMGSKGGLAIPVFIQENNQPVCVAVVLLALGSADLVAASSNSSQVPASICSRRSSTR